MKTKGNTKNIFARSPTLDTVLMIEEFIQKHSGDYTRRKLWQALPRKVMWQTFNVVIAYLEDTNKIGIDKIGYIVYVYNPKLARKYLKRKDLEWKG
jgi:hypothetical protein